MEIGQPHIDLDCVTPTWFPNTDFAHTLNAMAEARKRTPAFVRRDAIATLRRLVPVVSPRYDPADLGEPPYPHAILDRAAAT